MNDFAFAIQLDGLGANRGWTVSLVVGWVVAEVCRGEGWEGGGVGSDDGLRCKTDDRIDPSSQSSRDQVEEADDVDRNDLCRLLSRSLLFALCCFLACDR